MPQENAKGVQMNVFGLESNQPILQGNKFHTKIWSLSGLKAIS
jgi:hypothetical protein